MILCMIYDDFIHIIRIHDYILLTFLIFLGFDTTPIQNPIFQKPTLEKVLKNHLGIGKPVNSTEFSRLLEQWWAWGSIFHPIIGNIKNIYQHLPRGSVWILFGWCIGTPNIIHDPHPLEDPGIYIYKLLVYIYIYIYIYHLYNPA